MSHWAKDNVKCRVCCTGAGYSLMEHVGQAENKDELMWCPLCGTLAKLHPTDIIESDYFIAPYVSFDKELCCRNGGYRVVWKKH